MNLYKQDHKKCTSCKKYLPSTLDFFYVSKYYKDGLTYYCKECLKSQARAYEQRKTQEERSAYYKTRYQNNKHTILERQKQYNKNNLEKVRAMKRRYYPTHREEIKEYQREYYIKNTDHIKNRVRNWKQNNKQQVRSINANRRALKKRSGGTFNDKDIALQFSAQGKICWWCDSPIELETCHIEHRVPISRGGTNWPDNIVLSCIRCNLSKGPKLPGEWCGRLL